MFAAGAEARRRAREAAGVALQGSFTRLELLSHGIEVCASEVKSYRVACLMSSGGGCRTMSRCTALLEPHKLVNSGRLCRKECACGTRVCHCQCQPSARDMLQEMVAVHMQLRLHSAMFQLLACMHSLQATAGKDADLAAVLQRHLLRGAGAEAVTALLRFHVSFSCSAEHLPGQALKRQSRAADDRANAHEANPLKEAATRLGTSETGSVLVALQETDLQQDGGAAPDAAAAAAPQPLPPGERSTLLQRLPPDVGPTASAAVAALGGASAEVTQPLRTAARCMAAPQTWRRHDQGTRLHGRSACGQPLCTTPDASCFVAACQRRPCRLLWLHKATGTRSTGAAPLQEVSIATLPFSQQESPLKPKGLLAAVGEAAEAGGARLKRLDRKGERREVAAHSRALQEALEAETAPAAALSLAVPLLAAKVRRFSGSQDTVSAGHIKNKGHCDLERNFSMPSSALSHCCNPGLHEQSRRHLRFHSSSPGPQVWGKAVSLPGRALARVIEKLKAAGMAEADHAALTDFHAKVVASLTGGGGGSDGNAQQVGEQLAAALPGLKRLAGGGGGGDSSTENTAGGNGGAREAAAGSEGSGNGGEAAAEAVAL